MSAIVRGSSLDLGSSFPESVTIPINTATSNAWKVGQWASGGFALPAAFTGTSVSFSVSPDAGPVNGVNQTGTFQLLYDSTGALVTQAVTQGRNYSFPAGVFNFSQVKIVSNQNEAAARQISVFGKG